MAKKVRNIPFKVRSRGRRRAGGIARGFKKPGPLRSNGIDKNVSPVTKDKSDSREAAGGGMA